MRAGADESGTFGAAMDERRMRLLSVHREAHAPPGSGRVGNVRRSRRGSPWNLVREEACYQIVVGVEQDALKVGGIGGADESKRVEPTKSFGVRQFNHPDVKHRRAGLRRLVAGLAIVLGGEAPAQQRGRSSQAAAACGDALKPQLAVGRRDPW